MGTVAVNPPKTPVTKGSNGIATATLPNMCKMPGPPAPFVPVMLPNFGMSGTDPKDYSKKVKFDGQPVAIKGASFGSQGDVASKGTGGGLVSSNTHGPTKFVGPGSMDVKVEGKNVQLLGDPMLNNCGPSGSPANAATLAGVLQAPSVPPVSAPESTEEEENSQEKCEYCKKDKHALSKRPGKNNGNSTVLGNNIMKAMSGKTSRRKHPWNAGLRTLQAHHLICCEAMRDDDRWAKICRDFGYDIDTEKNGVMLPALVQLACQVSAPLHVSNHSLGSAYVDGAEMSYPTAVREKTDRVVQAALRGDYCGEPAKLAEKLNRISKQILGKVSGFKWTITADGKDYQAGKRGCGGVGKLKNRDQKASSCPDNRQHDFKHAIDKTPLGARTLEVAS